MIKLEFSTITGTVKLLTPESENYLKDIIRFAAPQSWGNDADLVRLMPDSTSARVYHKETTDNYLDVSINITDDNSLKSLKFSWDNGNRTSSWNVTPLTELSVQAALTKQEPTVQPRSMWAVRQEMIDEAYSTPAPVIDDDPEFDEPGIYSDTTDFDGVYDVDEKFLLTQDDIESKFGKYWYYFEQTAINYLKQNKVMATKIFSMKNIDHIELELGTLYVQFADGTKVEFIDLNIGQQISIIEELLYRANTELLK